MQVIAIYQGNEIAYGEGTSSAYAIEECISNIEQMYIDEALDEIMLTFADIGGSTYPKYMMLTEVYYRERQYF